MIGRLYQQNIGPGGELLVKRRQSKVAGEREEAAVAAYLAAHPYASAVELAEVRAAGRGKDPHSVPYFDVTVSAVKSVSVLHASYRVSARQARQHGDDEQAATLDANGAIPPAWQLLKPSKITFRAPSVTAGQPVMVEVTRRTYRRRRP